MTHEQEDCLIHDLTMVMVRHNWLTRSDWMKACERVGEGYLCDDEPDDDGHTLTVAATERAAMRLAAALERLLPHSDG